MVEKAGLRRILKVLKDSPPGIRSTRVFVYSHQTERMASEIKESESPPSQSQRADPLQSQSAAKLNKVYVFFWHAYSSVMYSLYEIEVPKHLPPPPDKATQADEIENPKKLLPVLQLKTGQYPDGMSCVSLGSKLYFFGGEFNMDNPYIDEDVKKNFKASECDVFPRQLLTLDHSKVGASGDELHKCLEEGDQMNSGKARPHAFVAGKKIYVIGSTIESSISHRSKLTRIENLESFKLFEVYDPDAHKWDGLPDPPHCKVNTRWVGHAIVGRKVLLVAWQRGKKCLYCFDLVERYWTDESIPFYPENFSGRTEFVEGTLYGCFHNTIAAIAPVEKKKIEKEEKKEKVEAEEGEKIEEKKVKAEQGEKLKEKEVKAEEGEKMEEKKVEAEEGEKMEAEKVKAKEDAKDFLKGWLLENPHLHVLSEEMGMDAIFNVPPQLQSSTSLLHLGNRYFCYVKSGMPPNSDNDSDDDIEDDKKRFISIVIFQALGKKYEKDGTGLLQAQFLYSAHYEINSPVPNEGFINGCFFPGSQQENIIITKKEKGQGRGTVQGRCEKERNIGGVWYSSGLELANFVVTLDILHDAWTAIWSLYTEISQNEGPSSFVRFKVYELPNYTIVAFFTWPSSSKDSVQAGGGGNLVSSSTFKWSFPFFDFLCPRPKDPDNKKNKPKDDPSFSINETAFQLFKSIFGVLPKFEIENSKQLIITGNSLGGSVATLFTLSLLEKFNFSKNKGPLCITFGSPLIGDENLQEAISKYAAWNSRFLHVVSDQDLVPRVLINGYQPFGTFLFCSKLGCSCFEDHQTILELLTVTNLGTPGNEDPNKVFESYGTFVKDLNRKVICKGTTDHESLIDWTTTPLRASIITQLAASGLLQSQQHENIVIAKTEKGAKTVAFLNQQAFDPTRGLNDIKVYMAYLEQYKKVSKDEKVGYYDRYKNKLDTSDIKVEEHMRRLTCYWEEMVDQAEKRPQTVGASLRTRSLFGGTNYRRMIEPLDIADYYKAGKQDYINQGRSKHYIILEQLLKETEKPSSGPNELKKQNVASSLTEDSCFWAHVEEARISCQLLRSGESNGMAKETNKLIDFENYVYGLMKNYAVSSEIFLPKSSFMTWWREYREIKGAFYRSHLTGLMNNEENYDKYAKGHLVIP